MPEELPEAVVIAKQINNTLKGKRITSAIANQSPHKLYAWYTGDPADYNNRLAGKTIGTATAHGWNVEIRVDDMILLISQVPERDIVRRAKSFPKITSS